MRRLLLTALLCTLLAPATAQAQSFGLPEPRPATIAFEDVELDREDRRRYLDEWRSPPGPDERLVLRVSAGGGALFDNGGGSGGAVGLQIEAGGRSLYRSGLSYQLSYGYGAAFGLHQSHVALIGGGFGAWVEAVSISYLFRAAFGALDDRAAAGFRHGVLLVFLDVVGVFVQHEMLDAEGDELLYHGLSAALTVDLYGAFGDLW